MKYLKYTVIVMALFFSQGARAHSDEYLDTQTAPHGGQLRMVGLFHYELVIKPDFVAVYLTDHAGTKQSSKGATGTATILSGKTKTTVTLLPGSDNELTGTGKFNPSPDMKVVVSITLPGKIPELGRFTPFNKIKP